MNENFVPEEWLGQIRNDADSPWEDYARGHEAPAKQWQAADPANRRLVHWISRKVLVDCTEQGTWS